jgi:WD40 repeat protein
MDGTIRLWQVADHTPILSVQANTGVIWAIALSGDGRLVVSGGRDGMVRLWDTRSGAELRTLHPDRRYERMDITGLTGITKAQKAALLALGAVEQSDH